MGAVTYPQASVQAEVSRRFMPVELNVKEAAHKSTVDSLGHTWTPDFRVLAAQGPAAYRWSGFLPPAEFVPQLLVAAGYVRLCLKENQESLEAYDAVLQAYPTSAAAPEAAYFLAVARYRLTGNRDDLRAGWRHLQLRYPTSIWREKQIYDELAH